jgi:hypothetical protein
MAWTAEQAKENAAKAAAARAAKREGAEKKPAPKGEGGAELSPAALGVIGLAVGGLVAFGFRWLARRGIGAPAGSSAAAEPGPGALELLPAAPADEVQG